MKGIHDQLTPHSKARRERIACPATPKYHAMIHERGWWYYCGCAPTIRGLDRGASSLGPKMRRYKQWAGR